MNNHCTTTIENARRAFFNERKEMEKKIEHLIEQLKQCKTKIQELQKDKKEYRKKYHNFSQKLIEKSQLIDAKLKEIKQKELSLQFSDRFVSLCDEDEMIFIVRNRNLVTLEEHNRLKRQLSQLLRKHAQFQDVLNTTQLNQQSSNGQTDVSDERQSPLVQDIPMNTLVQLGEL